MERFLRRKHNRKRAVPFPEKRSLAARRETKPVYPAAGSDLLTQAHTDRLLGEFSLGKGHVGVAPCSGLRTEAETNIT